jgi:LuxR family quorum-sensing system transcriptional regulator CciR
MLARLALIQTPTTWQELRRLRRFSRVEQRFWEAVLAYGWKDGLMVPLPRGGTRYGLVSLASMHREFSPADRDLAGAMTILFYERLRALTVGTDAFLDPANLTPREIACLALAARGLSDAAIGAKLGIQASTAHDHIERAKGRFAVRTRMEAVAIALSLGIIAI